MMRFKQFILKEMSETQLELGLSDPLETAFKLKMRRFQRGGNPDEHVRIHNKTGIPLFRHEGKIYGVRVIGGNFKFSPTLPSLKFENHRSLLPSKETSSEKSTGEQWFSHLLSKGTDSPIKEPPQTKESENARKAHGAFTKMFKGGRITKVYHVTTDTQELSKLTGIPNLEKRKFPHDTVVETEDGKRHGISLKLGQPTWTNLSVGSAFNETDQKLHNTLTKHWSEHMESAKKLAEKISGKQDLTNQDLKTLVRSTQKTKEYPTSIQSRRDEIEIGSANIHASHFNQLPHEEKQKHLKNLLEKDTSTMPLYVVSSYRGGEATNYNDLPFHKQIKDATKITASVVGKSVHFHDDSGNLIAKAEHRMTHFPLSPQINIKLPEKKEE